MISKGSTWSGEVAGGFCGTFLVYVVVGGLVGTAVAELLPAAQSCCPQLALCGAITGCDSAFARAFWFGAVGLPRFLLAWFGVALGLFAAVARGWTAGDMHFVLDVRMLALLWSIAMALMTWVGIRYWLAHSPIVAWLLLLAIVGHTAFIALNGISIGV